MLKVGVLIAALFALAPCASHGQVTLDVVGGASLFANCQASVRASNDVDHATEKDIDKAFKCMEYVAGYVDGLRLSKSVCPGDAHNDTMERVYVLFMEKHPKFLDEHRSRGLYAALAEASPCTVDKVPSHP